MAVDSDSHFFIFFVASWEAFLVGRATSTAIFFVLQTPFGFFFFFFLQFSTSTL